VSIYNFDCLRNRVVRIESYAKRGDKATAKQITPANKHFYRGIGGRHAMLAHMEIKLHGTRRICFARSWPRAVIQRDGCYVPSQGLCKPPMRVVDVYRL
jgi:hypothetical protein